METSGEIRISQINPLTVLIAKRAPIEVQTDAFSRLRDNETVLLRAAETREVQLLHFCRGARCAINTHFFGERKP
jgi:hypothetical protein